MPLLRVQRWASRLGRRSRALALSQVQYGQLESGVPMRNVRVLARLVPPRMMLPPPKMALPADSLSCYDLPARSAGNCPLLT